MKPADEIDPTTAIGVALLGYGRFLRLKAFPCDYPSPAPTDPLETLPFRRLGISILVRRSRKAQETFACLPDGTPRDFREIDIVAILFYRAMTEESPARLSWLCEVVSQGDETKLLEVRRTAFLLVKAGLLTYHDGIPPYNGTLSLSPTLFTFLTGKSPVPALFSEHSIAKSRLADGERVPAHIAKPDPVTEKPSPTVTPNPQRLYDEIRRHVIGLDPLVRTFVSRLHLHLKRVEQLKKNGSASTSPEALLFVGDSGTGKSWLASVGGRFSGLPFGNADMTGVTEDGWAGASVSDVCRSVIDAAGGNIEKAKNGGILFCDEIDSRRRSPGVERDISGGNVLKSLLKIMEGSEYMVGGRRGSWDTPIRFNTNGLCFIFAGSFIGLDEIFAKQTRKNSSLGFAVSLDGQNKSRDVYRALETFGMIPEFLNRLSAILFFPPCSVQQLIQIATAPTGVIASYASLLKQDGIAFKVSPEAVRMMAGWACESQTYSRGLKTLMSRLVEDAVFNGTKGKITFGVAEIRAALAGMGAAG